eukprot:1533479-Alexandrium_andersonii.AAC.1
MVVDGHESAPVRLVADGVEPEYLEHIQEARALRSLGLPGCQHGEHFERRAIRSSERRSRSR